MTKKQAVKKIKKISENKEITELKKRVCEMLINQLDGYKIAEDMFNDLSCENGNVSELIYYVDTYKFTHDYLSDIIELYQQGIEEYELKMPVDTDGVNWLAWFGFEQTAYEIENELGL